MCLSCKTPEGKIVAIGTHIKRIGTIKETLGVLVQCQMCGNYFLLDALSPLIEEVSSQWVQSHVRDFKAAR